MNGRLYLLAITLLCSSSAMAGGGHNGGIAPTAVPVDNQVGLIGLAIVLGLAGARIIYKLRK